MASSMIFSKEMDRKQTNAYVQALRKAFNRHKVNLMKISGVFLFFFCWYLVSRFKIINPFFISSPSDIAQQFVKSIISGKWIRDVSTSMLEFIIGYGLGVIVGIPLGFLCGRYKYAEYFIDSYIWLLYATPIIALFPIFLALFGLGKSVVIALAFIFSLVQVYSNTFTGVKTVDPLLVKYAKSYGAKEKEIFYKIAIPASIPLIIAGLRLAVGRAVLGVVVGELFGANMGVGFRLGYTASRMEVADYFVALLTVVLIGVVLSQAIAWVEGNFASWRTN